MGKITVIIPYPQMRAVVEQTFQEQNDPGWELDIIFATGVRGIARRRDISTDVVVARGVTAAALKRLMGDTPVVDMPVSGYDILRAVKACQQRFAATRIAIVGSKDMIYGAKSIEDIMDIKLAVVEVREEDDAEQSIRDLKTSGVDIVIGGVMSTQIAERLGLKTVFIETGREAIYHALREAKRVARVRRQEQERSEQFRAILDYSTEGIITVDAAGAINLVNAAAMKITGLPGEAVGRPVDKLLPQLGLSRVLASGRAELGEIETVNGQQLAVNRVPIIIGNQTVGAVATFQPVADIQALEGKIRQKIYKRGLVARLTFDDILGDSPAIRRTIATAREFSKVNSNVLITGETGTGKEIFAQSIHNASSRRKGPFVAVNCAALPENLLESELFGYAEGAFTGAARGGKMGLFELAHGGTIFLDEISEISPKLQGRLLRVLQEREIMRLGDDRVIPVDVRIIAATNRDLYQMMQAGLFRQDLYYRVDVLKLVLPPLRERQEDIIPLMRHFLRLYCLRSNRPVKEIDPDAQVMLCRYHWPGNVRELRNIAERLAVLASGPVIGARDIAAVLTGETGRRKAINETAGPAAALAGANDVDLNRAILLKALEEADYHYGRAAARLGISRTTLWRRLKQYQVGE
ncbi:sigma 54-interacting transcriptional regulator [Sporolituus thermophilus]|uniref:PAS domain S-box-containing protein n=1 Tax=Sporolituus thermophilus DSM 23256 TaxID=1123285 RepID=A0A1G7NW41_9FIRM|nr:sigma 54-interacting transcriptional regulator [Sporolituus thermophilus]SDF78107.1 PAS domain S-box-containing protein [Sporolituus thermophilus DSM 23256]